MDSKVPDKIRRAVGLVEALQAVPSSEYTLISPAPDVVSVFTRPGKLIPQFARLLVAESLRQLFGN